MSSTLFAERLAPLLSHIIYRRAALLCDFTRNAGSAKLKLLPEAYRAWPYLEVHIGWAMVL